MRETISLLFIACLILPAIWPSGSAQQRQGETHVEYRGRLLEECKQAVLDAEIRMNSLKILLDAYPTTADSTPADITKTGDWRHELVELEVTEYKRCWEVKWAEYFLQSANEIYPSPTPTPGIGPNVNLRPTPTPTATPTPSPSPRRRPRRRRRQRPKPTATPTPTPSPSPAAKDSPERVERSPSPTPTPGIGPIVIQRPTPTPSPTATPTPSPSPAAKASPEKKLSKEEEEEIKRLKALLDRLGPLTVEINDWVKKQKAKLKPVPPPKGLETDLKSQPGLQTVSFDMPQGNISVNMPFVQMPFIGGPGPNQGITSGPHDFGSGTVEMAPKGQTEAERTQNQSALLDYAIELQIPEAGDVTSIIRVPILARNNTFTFIMPTNAGDRSVMCNLVSLSGYDLSQVALPLNSAPPTRPSSKTPTPRTFQFPSIGQNGRPLEILGPFDGSFKTTEIKIGGQPARLLAESRNSCIVQAPDQNFGPTEITVKEGDVEAKGSCRNLGLRLAAPKTSLLKGETTVLTVTVEGLKGIQHDVPLLLQKEGVVSMAGGDTQTVQIRPADVRADGTFETKRTLTGLQAGNFGVTATVIDPAHRPIIIPLIENAKVNGYRVKKDGDKFVIEVEGVQSPITGKPVDGEHKLEHQCPALSDVPNLGRLFLNNGTGRSTVNCLKIMVKPTITIQEE